MKKILNNVWGIAGLCVVGAALITWRIILPIMGAGDDQFAAQDVVLPEADDWLEAETSIEAERHTLTAVEATAVNWNPNPIRDPFTARRNSDQPESGRVSAQQPAAARYYPTLNALVSGSRSNLAIIDGRVVVKGDRIADYLVTSIGASGVGLFHELDGTSSLITVQRQ